MVGSYKNNRLLFDNRQKRYWKSVHILLVSEIFKEKQLSLMGSINLVIRRWGEKQHAVPSQGHYGFHSFPVVD
jgi:hypothetical protein